MEGEGELSFCRQHTIQSLVSREELSRKRAPALNLAQRCLEGLEHYKRIKVESEETTESGNGDQSKASAIDKKPEFAPMSLDQIHDSSASISHAAIDHDVNDSDTDVPTVEGAWNEAEDSDAESIDSDFEDPLRHAGAYSAEEVIRIMRDKLIRLQKLYIDQFQRLQHVLRENKRNYLQQLRTEKEEHFMPIHSQPKQTSEEISSYKKLKALSHYNKPQGIEAVLHHQLLEKRLRVYEGDNSSSTTTSKCAFNLTTTMKCGEVCIPMSKYCIKHILEDSNQTLFRACGFVTEADDPCETPILDVLDNATCVYHTRPSPSVYEDKV